MLIVAIDLRLIVKIKIYLGRIVYCLYQFCEGTLQNCKE